MLYLKFLRVVRCADKTNVLVNISKREHKPFLTKALLVIY